MVDKVKKQYQDAYDEHGNSLNAVFIPKGRQTERFDSLFTHVNLDRFSVLDYGCGLGQMCSYVKKKYPKAKYSGVDIVEGFISENKSNYSSGNFSTIKDCYDIDDEFDVIVAAGVFNLLYVEDKEEHQQIVYDNLKHLFSRTKNVLSVNFMTDQVDFVQEGAFHQNVMKLYDFAISSMTKRVAIDQSYMPYEFTFHFFKNESILRPDNIYQS